MEIEKTGGAIETVRGVYRVGAIDWNGRTFRGLPLQAGQPATSTLLLKKILSLSIM